MKTKRFIVHLQCFTHYFNVLSVPLYFMNPFKLYYLLPMNIFSVIDFFVLSFTKKVITRTFGINCLRITLYKTPLIIYSLKVFTNRTKPSHLKILCKPYNVFIQAQNTTRKSSGMERANKLGVSITNCCQVIVS